MSDNKAAWQDRSEIVAGLVFAGIVDKNQVNPGDFSPPYDDIIGDVRKGATTEDIIAKHGFSYYQVATMAANAVTADQEEAKKKPVDWVHLLEQASSFYKKGKELANMADLLMSGQPIDPGKLLQYAGELDLGYRTLTPLDQVEPEEGQWIKTGYHPIDEYIGGVPKAGLVALAGGTGIGKCLAKGTKVVMLDGTTKNVEDVRPGDYLLGPDSLPRKVQSVTTGNEMMYWVRQNKGIDYRVNESHILSLKLTGQEPGRAGKKGDVVNISVRDYLTKSNKFKHVHKGYKVAVDFPAVDVPVHPYVLGAWLGDGTSSKAALTLYDDDVAVIDRIQSLGVPVVRHQYGDKAPRWVLSDGVRRGLRTGDTVQEKLRELGVLNDKHIPQVYLSNSRDVRMGLLAGLIDTDGYYHNSGVNMYEITQKNKRLAEQIKFLADSLGYRTSIKEKKARSQNGTESIVYRVLISGDLREVPIVLPRKRQPDASNSRVDYTVTGIRVEQDKVDTYYGFTLDGDGLFLLEDMTVTHNTTLALRIALEMIRLYDGRKNTKRKGLKYADPMYAQIPAEKGKVAIFSLEMLLSQVVARFFNVDGSITKDERSRILASESSYTVGEIYAVAARAAANENLKAIIIDFADMLVEGEQSEAIMGVIYRALAMLAKTTGVPVILVCQFSRKEDATGIPKINWIRYSGMAEMMSSLILMLYNPSVTVVDIKEHATLPYSADHGYIIVGKSRFGFKMGHPGAIQVPFKGETGWGDLGIHYFPVHA